MKSGFIFTKFVYLKGYAIVTKGSNKSTNFKHKNGFFMNLFCWLQKTYLKLNVKTPIFLQYGQFIIPEDSFHTK